MKFKEYENKIKIIHKKRLLSHFNHLKSLKSNKIKKIEIHDHYNTNSYYNDLIGIFDNDSDNDNDNNKNNNNNDNNKTKDNYYAIVLLLNDYKNLIGDYNDLIISMICNNNTCH
jgi:hypothetical protein